ncbi:MAG: LysM peptidoglycan-binding domain-containing protein [Cytophagaceae bacterium]|nr:LysM peptidoglycan-binding domain-containing protein [Cytophagaceae bacterium]
MMKKTMLLLFLIFVGSNYAFSQSDEGETVDSVNYEIIENNTSIELDSITGLVVDSISEATELLVEELSDSVYIARLSAINSPIELPFNSQVKSYIKLYTQKRRSQVENMLGLAEYYFPLFEEVLDANNLPLELKYLPIIESALNPKALSRAGASGIWQFMYYTGKRYGLEINSYIDERRDPVKATHAAADFISDLYNRYNDWHLAIAAYNCGPGNVDKAIRRSGGKRDFWEIYYRLPRETRGYVPAFIAAAYVMSYAAEHKLYPQQTIFPSVSDTIMVSQPLHFEQIAATMHISVETLRELNPQYRRDIIPAKNQSYALRLSSEQSLLFASNEDSIYTHKRQQYFTDNRLIVNPVNSDYPVVAPEGRAAVQYTVKSGDAVGLIADWFDVRTADLRYWNNLRGNMIRTGQKLTVYVPKNKESHYKTIAQSKSKSSGKAVAPIQTTTKTTTSISENGKYEYYTVKSGDNLWTIAKKYPGVSNEDILKLNNIADDRKIKPGQKLKIRPLS